MSGRDFEHRLGGFGVIVVIGSLIVFPLLLLLLLLILLLLIFLVVVLPVGLPLGSGDPMRQQWELDQARIEALPGQEAGCTLWAIW